MAPYPTVFIIGNDPAVRDSLRVLLEVHQFAVSQHGSIRSFADEYRSRGGPVQPCILLNLDLPGRIGLEILRMLVASGADLPVVVIASDSTDAVKAEAETAGVVAVVEKPFADGQLLSHIREALAQTDCITP